MVRVVMTPLPVFSLIVAFDPAIVTMGSMRFHYPLVVVSGLSRSPRVIVGVTGIVRPVTHTGGTRCQEHRRGQDGNQ